MPNAPSSPTRLFRGLATAAGLTALAGCAHQPSSVALEEKQLNDCPIELHTGQSVTLSLPSDPTSGFRWIVRDAAAPVLKSLGPEVFSVPETPDVIGAPGQSTWRFQVVQAGDGRLRMDYRRPWENTEAAEKTVDCQITVR